MVKHKVAKGIILYYMIYNGFYGWTSFWNTIYYRDSVPPVGSSLRKHELKHIEQIYREGRIKFFFRYVYYSYKYGYRNNPYEIEARKAENEVVS